jgi:hypothetical protein
MYGFKLSSDFPCYDNPDSANTDIPTPPAANTSNRSARAAPFATMFSFFIVNVRVNASHLQPFAKKVTAEFGK